MACEASAAGCAGSRRVLVLLSESLKLWLARWLPCEEGETRTLPSSWQLPRSRAEEGRK